MKARGFTLLELLIVLVLIGISAVFSTRFIADMATTYVGAAERGQALAGARFAMERIKRELSLAYSPSVYVGPHNGADNRCVSFVPALASGRYIGKVKNKSKGKDKDKGKSATFVIPLTQQGHPIQDVNVAVRADSGKTVWEGYPQTLPTNVAEFNDQTPEAPSSVSFVDAFDSSASFEWEGMGNRYVFLHRYQVRFCLDDQGELWREKKEGTADWSDKTLMLTGLIPDMLFSDYNESLQLLVVNFRLATREGDLVLPNQIPVIYEP